MAKRLLILRAGSASSNNLVRSLQAANAALSIIGCNEDRFVLKKSAADLNYVLPAGERAFPRALRAIIEKEHVDLLIPTRDTDVLKIARLRTRLPCRTFLPRTSTIERCQDKYELTVFLRRRGIPAPLTYPITALKNVDALFRRFKGHPRLWCRIRAGTGSFGAIPVTKPEQVRSWVRYWEAMRGIPAGSFTLSEYLPGRDFCVQSLWKNGKLILTKMAERITYIDTGSPSGVSSTPALAKTVFDPAVIDVCAKAIRTLDRKAHGVFFLDVKESADGRPCITEINAGRFATITNIHDLTGKHNMAEIYVRLAVGEKVDMCEASDIVEDHYLVRSVDTVPTIMTGANIFEGIKEWTP